MIYTVAAGLASTLSFIVLLLMATWYVIPWLKSRSRADALTALLWVQAFRYVALQIFSAQKFGFAVSDGARDQIAAGDVAGHDPGSHRDCCAALSLARGHSSGLGVRRGNRARSCERDDRRYPRGAFLDGVRGHLAHSHLLCPAVVVEPWPDRLAAIFPTPRTAFLCPCIS